MTSKKSAFSSRRLAISIAGLALAIGSMQTIPAGAQTSMVIFKNFHRYPTSGLWSQQLSGMRNGVSMGAPVQSTSCTGVADPKALAQMQKLSETTTTPNACKTTVLSDTERSAEYERVCQSPSGAPRVTRSTMKYVDDKTMTVDTRDDIPGFVQTVIHSQMTYMGTCTASANKPSAADCAEMAAGAQEAAAGEAQCAEVPAAYRAQCLSQMAASRKAMDAMRTQCR